MSTFVVEMDEPTFFRAGFDALDAVGPKRPAEQIFAETLDGHSLMFESDRIWRQFPKVWNERWSVGNRVLVEAMHYTQHIFLLAPVLGWRWRMPSLWQRRWSGICRRISSGARGL